MYILKSATTWYVSNSIPKLAKAYNAKLHDERFFLHVQHLYERREPRVGANATAVGDGASSVSKSNTNTNAATARELTSL